jgi:hypothetical protein
VNDLFWRNEVTLISSYGGSPADYAAALELIRTGKIRVREMITHRLGLAETGHFCLSLRPFPFVIASPDLSGRGNLMSPPRLLRHCPCLAMTGWA